MRAFVPTFAVFLAVSTLAGSDQALRPIKTVPPVHPPELLAAGVEGSATVLFTVDANGDPADVSVAEATYPAFGDAAVAAVRQWKFSPAMRDGAAIAVQQVKQSFQFPLPLERRLSILAGRAVYVAEPRGVIDAWKLQEAPTSLDWTEPAVADEVLKRLGYGEVDLEFIITPEGRAINPQIIGATAREYAIAALESVVQAKWAAPQHEGKPVHVRTTRNFVFGGSRRVPEVVAVADGGSREVFAPEDLDKKPTPTKQVPPQYPFDMKRRGITGRVLVAFIIGRDGQTTDVKVVESSHPAFNEAALAAIRQWRFRPGFRDNRTVATRMELPLFFNINDR